MINNKQVNVWRGTGTPPTEYHVWILETSANTQLLLFNGAEWIVFLDDKATIEKINEVISAVATLEQNVTTLQNNTINAKKISTNPVLNGTDLKLSQNGDYVASTDSVTESVLKLDILFQTQMIE